MEKKWEQKLEFQRQRRILETAFQTPGHFVHTKTIKEAMRMRQMMERPAEFIVDPTRLGATLLWIGDIQPWNLEEYIRVQVILERVIKPSSFEIFPKPNNSEQSPKHKDEIQRRLRIEILRRNQEE